MTLFSSGSSRSGFTLLEILLVIGIIAVLATVVVVSLDPAKRFRDAQNSRRLSDIQSILSAVHQYIVDNRGELPSGLNTNEMQLGNGSGCVLSTNICNISEDSCLDLSSDLGKYLKTIPYDPSQGTEGQTHYSISVDSNNIVTVSACEGTDTTIATVSR